MPLNVVPATESDAPRAISIETVAYGPNPIGPSLFPGPFSPAGDGSSPRVNQIIKLLREDPACRWVKVVDTDITASDGSNENMIAFACWYLWDTPQPKAEPSEWPQGANAEACEMFFGGMRERREERFQGKPFVYLKLLHTDPAHQRRGAGSMLLKWGAEQADRLGLDSYLEASPEGKYLYAKRDFKEVDVFVADFSKWGGPKEHPTSLMMRAHQQ